MKIENTPTERIVNIVEAQREFFRSGTTLKRDFRKKQLKRLLEALNLEKSGEMQSAES